MRGRIAGLKVSGRLSSCHDFAMSWMVERIGPEDRFLGLAMHYTAGNPCRNGGHGMEEVGSWRRSEAGKEAAMTKTTEMQ